MTEEISEGDRTGREGQGEGRGIKQTEQWTGKRTHGEGE